MSKYIQTTYCTYCGEKDSVNVITQQTKFSRYVKITRCKKCDKQNGVKETLNKSTL